METSNERVKEMEESNYECNYSFGNFVCAIKYYFDEINYFWCLNPKRIDSDDRTKFVLRSIREGLTVIVNNSQYIKMLSSEEAKKALHILKLAKCVANKDLEALEAQGISR